MTAPDALGDNQPALRREGISELIELMRPGMYDGNCGMAAVNVYDDGWRHWTVARALAADKLMAAAQELGVTDNALQSFKDKEQELRQSRPPS